MRLRPSGNAGPLATSLAGFSALSARQRLDLGASGAEPRPRRRTPTTASARSIDGGDRRRPGAAARRRQDHRRRDRDARADGQGAPAAPCLRPEARRRRAGRSRVHRPVGAAGGRRDDRPCRRRRPRRSWRGWARPACCPKARGWSRSTRIYSTVLQVMSAALADPFKDEGWTDAFRELLAQLTNMPEFRAAERRT